MRKHLHPHVKLILPTICMLDRTSQKLRLQVHGIERVDGLVIVGLDLTCENKVASAFILSALPHNQWRCASPGCSQFSPSGISSRPLSTEAMIAVSIEVNI